MEVDANPMHRADAAPRCSAKSKRTGLPCRSPAVTGWAVCRMHGARGGARPGKENPAPANLADDDILHRLVDLNRERAAEEARGHVRWLRPDYQNPEGRAALATREQAAMDLGRTEITGKAPWPKALPEQIAAVSAALTDMGEATPDQIARRFGRARTASIAPLLQALTALNHAREVAPGRYAP